MSSTPAFEEELLTQLPALKSFSRSLCSQTADAEDLVQETLTKALLNRDKYVPYGSLKSWLFTIMKNTFCSKFKRAARETDLSEWDDIAAPASQDYALELQDVGRALDDLPNIYRQALKHVALDGLPYEAAANEMNCSVGTVKSRLNRARCQLERRR